MEEQKQNIVKVMLVRPNKNRVPPELLSGVTKTIGSAWERGTSRILIGINDNEIKYLMPKLIRVKPENPEFNQAVNAWFENLNITVSAETGKELNVTTKKIKTIIDGKEVEIDDPVNIKDYIMYKQCLKDSRVAKNEDEAKGEMKSFYIADPNVEKAIVSKITTLKDQVDRYYLKFTEREGEKLKYEKEVNAILRIKGNNPLFMDTDEKVQFLSALKEADKKSIDTYKSDEKATFIKIAKDPDLTQKGFIFACLTSQIFSRRGDYIVDSNDSAKVIGRSIEEAVAWLKDNANSADKMNYVTLLKQKSGAKIA